MLTPGTTIHEREQQFSKPAYTTLGASRLERIQVLWELKWALGMSLVVENMFWGKQITKK